MQVLAIVALLVAAVMASETHQKRQFVYSGYGYPAATYGYGATYGVAAYPATVGYGYPAYGYGTHFIGKRSTDETSRAKRQVIYGAAYPAYGYGLGASTYGYGATYGYPSTFGYGYPAYGGLVYGK